MRGGLCTSSSSPESLAHFFFSSKFLNQRMRNEHGNSWHVMLLKKQLYTHQLLMNGKELVRCYFIPDLRICKSLLKMTTALVHRAVDTDWL